MNEPWYDANHYGWIPGVLLGVLGGLLGPLAGLLVLRGRAKGLIFGMFIAGIIYSAILLVLGAAAFFLGQSYGVWYGLGLPGAIGLVVLGVNLIPVRLGYLQAEARKLAARDLTDTSEPGIKP